MSLGAWRERLEEAALGSKDDPAVRAHLRDCAECRAHYDLLVLQARALAGKSEPTRAEEERELARLLEALPGGKAPAAEAPRRWRWAFALAGAATAAVVAVVVLQPPPADEVSWRGGEGEHGAPAFSVKVLTAPRDGGPAGFVGTLPQDALKLRAADWVGFAPEPPGRFQAVLVNEQREVVKVPASGSLALAAGRWRLLAVPLAAGAPDDEAGLEAAARAAGVDGELPPLPPRLSGRFTVEP